MCHIGLFNQFISRFGLFRLKVKDPAVCVSCKTKDCAKACPVGLTDFRAVSSRVGSSGAIDASGLEIASLRAPMRMNTFTMSAAG